MCLAAGENFWGFDGDDDDDDAAVLATTADGVEEEEEEEEGAAFALTMSAYEEGSILRNSAYASASSTVIAIACPQGTSLPSASTKIFAKTPSSCTSKPTDALSVSISHKISPAFNASPGFLRQLDIVPAVIVGDKDGIGTLDKEAALRRVDINNIRFRNWDSIVNVSLINNKCFKNEISCWIDQ